MESGTQEATKTFAFVVSSTCFATSKPIPDVPPMTTTVCLSSRLTIVLAERFQRRGTEFLDFGRIVRMLYSSWPIALDSETFARFRLRDCGTVREYDRGNISFKQQRDLTFSSTNHIEFR